MCVKTDHRCVVVVVVSIHAKRNTPTHHDPRRPHTYLDTTCAQRAWDTLVGITVTQHANRSSHIDNYVQMAVAAEVAGPAQETAPFLCPIHPLGTVLRNGRQLHELLRLRIGAGAVRDHHVELHKPPGSRWRVRTPRLQRVCVHCNNGSVDDVPHAFFRCVRSSFSRTIAQQELVTAEAMEGWSQLAEHQRLSLLLLFCHPAALQLPSPGAVRLILGRWLTAMLDSFITKPFRPLAY